VHGRLLQEDAGRAGLPVARDVSEVDRRVALKLLRTAGTSTSVAMASLARLMRSQIDLSLPGLLGQG